MGDVCQFYIKNITWIKIQKKIKSVIQTIRSSKTNLILIQYVPFIVGHSVMCPQSNAKRTDIVYITNFPSSIFILIHLSSLVAHIKKSIICALLIFSCFCILLVFSHNVKISKVFTVQ